MKLRQYPSVHDGSIHSLDWHSSGELIATCGQTTRKEGFITIWAAKHLNNKDSDGALLAELRLQNVVPNCIRWSKSEKGRMVACAVDGGPLKIYEYLGKRDLQLVHNLKGHTMDVLHCEWSLDGRFLASSSLDSTVIVWKADELPEKITVLENHTEAVKGVSFDPTGHFLATQASDKCVRVWNTNNWKCEKTISETFSEGKHTWIRLDWSPEGSFLVAPDALKHGRPTAEVISRNAFQPAMNFVGHQKVVTCVKACPRLLSYDDRKGQQRHVSCFAVASCDKSLSLWCVPYKTKPLLVLKNFRNVITDFSWFGTQLAASSVDGSLIFLDFNSQELGELLSDNAMRNEFEKLYQEVPLQYLTAEEKEKSIENIRKGMEQRNKPDSFAEPSDNLVGRKLDKERIQKEKECFAVDQRQRESRENDAPAESGKASEPRSPSPIRSKSKRKRVIVESDESNAEDEVVVPAKRSCVVEKRVQRNQAPVPCKKVIPHGISIPEKMSHFTVKVSEIGPFCETSSILVENDQKVLDRTTVCRVTAANSSNVQTWTCFVDGTVYGVEANSHYTVVKSSHDKTSHMVSVFTTSTGRLLNRFATDGAAVKSNLRRALLLILSSAGTVYMWNLESLTNSPVMQESVLAILAKDVSVEGLAFSVSGCPIVILTDGKSCVFSERMNVWVLVRDDGTIFQKFSYPIRTEPGDRTKELTASCQTNSLHKASVSVCGAATEVEMEQALISAQVSNSASEYKELAVRYMRRLATNGQKAKIAEFLLFLKQRDTVCSLNTANLISSLKPLINQDLLYNQDPSEVV